MSYWIPNMEDYDGYFITELKKITVEGQPVHVTYYMPEHEGNQDVHLQRPAILFYSYDQMHDKRREQSSTDIVVSDTPSDVSTNKVPTPMKFFYQFVILTDYKAHENEILKQFNTLFPTRGFITLADPDGGEVSYDFFQKQFLNGDSYQEVPNGGTTKERIFRKIYRYHLYSEIEESQAKTYKKVQSVNPTTSLKE
jgi:hypothetical protein